MRISIASLAQGENANLINLDLILDESSFNKYFEYIEPNQYFNSTSIPKENFYIKSLKVVKNKFIEEIQDAIRAFEKYLMNEFGGEV